MPATGGGGAQRAQLFLRDPRRQDLPRRVVIDAAVPHPRQRSLGEPLPATQQQPAVRPRRVDLAATAAQQVAGDPLAHRGHRRVREHDQVEVVHRDRHIRQSRADGGGVAGVRVDHHHLDPGPERRRAGGQPGLHRGAGAAIDLPQQGLIAGDVDEPGLPRIRALPPDPAVRVPAVGQPPRPPEPGLVHTQHPYRLRLDQLDRAAGHHRALHRRPRHPMRRRDLGLIAAVLHRHRQRRPQPRGGAHPGRNLRHLLGERRTRTVLGAAAPAPLAPLHRDLPAATRQVVRPGQHPVLARGRHHPTCRAASRVRVVGDQLHDPNAEPRERDTLHRQALQAQQARRIISTVNHGPWLSLRCSRTQRGSRSHGPPTIRRAAQVQTSGCPVKIEEPVITHARAA